MDFVNMRLLNVWYNQPIVAILFSNNTHTVVVRRLILVVQFWEMAMVVILWFLEFVLPWLTIIVTEYPDLKHAFGMGLDA